jgi:hypothetical protein
MTVWFDSVVGYVALDTRSKGSELMEFVPVLRGGRRAVTRRLVISGFAYPEFLVTVGFLLRSPAQRVSITYQWTEATLVLCG